jgi:hypothetical protein
MVEYSPPLWMSSKGPSHYATMGSVACRIHTTRPSLWVHLRFWIPTATSCDNPKLFGRTFLAIPLFLDHHMLDVLSLSSVFFNWLEFFDQGRVWRVFFGGSRVGTRLLSGVVLELFSRRAWRERRIRLGWAQHGMLSRSKAQLPSSVNSSVRFFVLFLTLHFSLF